MSADTGFIPTPVQESAAVSTSRGGRKRKNVPDAGNQDEAMTVAASSQEPEQSTAVLADLTVTPSPAKTGEPKNVVRYDDGITAYHY